MVDGQCLTVQGWRLMGRPAQTPMCAGVRVFIRTALETNADVGVGMLRGAGDSLTWKSLLVYWFQSFLVSDLWVSGFLGFLVSWFLSFLVSWFQRVLVLKFLGFKESKIYQLSISCFQEDFDPMSKILKTLLDEPSVLFSAHLFPDKKATKPSRNFEIYKIIFPKWCWVSLILWSIIGSPKIKRNGFGAQGHVQKSRNHRTEDSEVLP